MTYRNMAFFLISSMVLEIFLINCRSSDNLSDRIARAFNRSGATQAVVLDIFKAFDRI